MVTSRFLLYFHYEFDPRATCIGICTVPANEEYVNCDLLFQAFLRKISTVIIPCIQNTQKSGSREQTIFI